MSGPILALPGGSKQSRPSPILAKFCSTFSFEWELVCPAWSGRCSIIPIVELLKEIEEMGQKIKRPEVLLKASKEGSILAQLRKKMTSLQVLRDQ